MTIFRNLGPIHVLCAFSTDKVKVKVKQLSRVQLFVTPWTVTYQAPLSMGFSRQQYWSGLPFPSPRDFSDPGTEPGSSALQADTLPSEPPEKSTDKVHTFTSDQQGKPFGGKEWQSVRTLGKECYVWTARSKLSICKIRLVFQALPVLNCVISKRLF